jgi:flavodoxin
MHGVLYYSTISGNTRLVGEALQGTFANAGITLTLQDVAEDTTWNKEARKDKKEVDGCTFLIFACGTYGHGHARKKSEKMLSRRLWKDVKHELNPLCCYRSRRSSLRCGV